ncbi:unnamed protein product, partial [Adineta steineri]
VKEWYREFIFGYLEPDGIFMLRLLSSNTSDFVCTEVINHLWHAFYMKDPKQLKRKRKHELGGDSSIGEITRQASDPVDLSASYDSIRRRSNNFPAPPSDKTNTNYGPLIPTSHHQRFSSITTKQSSLSTLVEGDV